VYNEVLPGHWPDSTGALEENFMHRFRNTLVGIAVVGTLAIIGTLMDSRQSAMQAGPTISGTVEALQSGAWNVGIVTEQASQLIRLTQLFTVNVSSACGQNGDEDCHPLVQVDSDGIYVNYPNGYTVPAGQKLVITTVSFYPNLNNTAGFADIQLHADTALGGGYGAWNVDRTRSSEFHPTGIVVNSGHSLEAVVTMVASAQLVVEVQGYLTAN
jgi:hypothetical protein